MMTIKFLRSVATIAVAFCGFSASANTTQEIASWNMEWLSSVQSDKISTPLRSSEDYQVLAEHFSALAPDVMAFQEVNDKQALLNVIGERYQILFSDRQQYGNAQNRFDDINQYTGFAIKRGIEYLDKPDIRLDNDKSSKLRFASYLVLEPLSARPIHMLSVHLKAGCATKYKARRSCRILQYQATVLNQWIKVRERNQQHYLILGDFNHNLAYPKDWLWGILAEGTDATLATRTTPAVCKVKSRHNPTKPHQFPSLIDHVVTNEPLAVASTKQWVFPIEQVIDHQLTDHCPITATIN